MDGPPWREIIGIRCPASTPANVSSGSPSGSGITAETVRAFEQYLNKKYAAQLGKRPITLYLVPTTRDELLDDVERASVHTNTGSRVA